MLKRAICGRVSVLAAIVGLCACAHAREAVYLRPDQPIDLKKLDLHEQSLIIPLTAGEVLPLDVSIGGDFVATKPGAMLELQVKRSCFVRVDDRGLRISPDGRDFDEKPRRKGSFQIGLGVTNGGKRASLQVVTPSRIP